MSRTKVVATIGPASSDPEVIRGMLHAGLNVARINFSHGTHEQHRETIAMLRQVAEEEKMVLAILGDLQGPKIRMGNFDDVTLKKGETAVFSSDENHPEALYIPHPEIVEALFPNARIVLGDGEMELEVVAKSGNVITCKAVYDGVVQKRKGINTPGTRIPIATITKKDRIDLEVICELDLDFVALSFVRSASDIHELRGLMRYYEKNIPIIAKIEKFEAIENLDEIAEAADGMMVARGDLGLDLPMQQLPMHQKRIIHSGNILGKPVITATQMLASMTKNPRPTRAEASDVANAILDGTDAVMLSNETATGDYPVESVSTMTRIAEFTEAEFPYDIWESKRKEIQSLDDIGDAISIAACNVAERLDAKMIVTSTVSGYTARQIARHRPKTAIVAVSPISKTQRLLSVVWGVECALMDEVESTDQMMVKSLEAITEPATEPGDLVVLTGGVPFGKSGLTNLIQIQQI